VRSGNSGTQSTRESLRKSKRPQMVLAISPDQQVPDNPQLLESYITTESGVYAADFLRMPPPRKHSNWTKRSSMSSGLTNMTPISQKIVPSRRPSYLLSSSLPHTVIPTWQGMYGRQGLQSDPRLETSPVLSRADSINRKFVSSHLPVVPPVLSIAGSPICMSPPPRLTKFQPIAQASLPANTPPVQRRGGMRGPRPLVTTSRPRNRT
jgi:hypothetical protein